MGYRSSSEGYRYKQLYITHLLKFLSSPFDVDDHTNPRLSETFSSRANKQHQMQACRLNCRPVFVR